MVQYNYIHIYVYIYIYICLKFKNIYIYIYIYIYIFLNFVLASFVKKSQNRSKYDILHYRKYLFQINIIL